MEREQKCFYFSPDSKMWEVFRGREIAVFGAQTMLLMQVAHPKVAAAVDSHSDFMKNPIESLKRLLETQRVTSAMIFGTKEEVYAAADKIVRIHEKVRGDSYYAGDPEALAWVLTTLVVGAIKVHDRFVRPLSSGEKDEFYQDAKKLLPLLHGDEQALPTSYDELGGYKERMLADEKVKVGPTAKKLSKYILGRQLPILAACSYPLSRIAVGLLDKEIRQQYGFRWSPWEEKLLIGFSTICRKVLPILPARVRLTPYYRRAQEILTLCNGR